MSIKKRAGFTLGFFFCLMAMTQLLQAEPTTVLAEEATRKVTFNITGMV